MSRRDSVEQPPLYQRTTPTKFPAFFQAVGAMFSTMAMAAVARIALAAGHFAQGAPLTAALSWLPALSWLGAGLMVLPAVGRPARTPFP